MGQLGIGAMIGYLCGNEESVAAWKSVAGKKIAALSHTDKAVRIEVDDGTAILLSDEGQSCCEHRYMTTDDRLEEYVGGVLLDAEIKDGPTNTGEYGDEHEVQFLEIKTSKGSFTMANHNEHNGYYGGFWVIARAA